MSRVDDLDEKSLSRISSSLSRENMQAVGVIYLGLEKHELRGIKRNFDVLTRWKNISYDNNRQRLADILYHAADKHHLLDVKYIKQYLQVEKPSDNPVLPKDPPHPNSPLTDSELGQLAMLVSPENMRSLAERFLNYSQVTLETITAARGDDMWGAKYDVLADWKNASFENERKKLAKMLYEAAEVDKLLNIWDIQKVLGVSKEMLEEEVGATGQNEDGASTEVLYSRNENPTGVTDEPDNPGEIGENHGSGEPEPTGASTSASMDVHLPDLLNVKELKRKLAGTQFPEGQPMNMLPLFVPGYEKHFDWLKLDEIRKITNPMTKKSLSLIGKKVKPVVVAVVDSGVYEEHQDLKDHILTKWSKCFVTGDNAPASDLRRDQDGHGTMVSGVIVLNGPDNVKIINLKILPKPTNRPSGGNMAHLVAALKYIKTLDGTSDEVDIINMSVGQFHLVEGLDEVISDLAPHKIIIAAAGNYSAHASNTITYPAKHPSVICVGASDEDGNPSGMSSRGDEVVCLCPGESVPSTSNMNNGQKYTVANGTSFSSPYACAVAAHVLVAMEAKKGLEYRKKLRKNLVMRQLFRQMRDEAPPGGARGLLNPYNNSFFNLEQLYIQCDHAIEGREGHVRK